MDRLNFIGAISAFGVLLALPLACSGSSFTAGMGGSSNGSGGSNAGSGGKSGGLGGSVASGGSKATGGEGSGAGPGTGGVGTAGDVGMAGDVGIAGDVGMAGSVGTGGAGMTDAGVDCVFGSIQFVMKPGSNAPAGSFCTETCIPWVTVYSHVENKWLTLSNDCSTNDCETCELPPCIDIACISQPLPSTGIETNWDGTNYVNDTCMKLGIDVTCNKPVCLPIGAYEARMCAYINELGSPDICQPSTNQACKDVNFEFDGGEIIVAGEIEP